MIKHFACVAFLASSSALGGEIVLSVCKAYPNFDASMIRYQSRGPSSYGLWFYDLVYRLERKVLLTDNFGDVRCNDPIVRSTTESVRFEVSEQNGRRETLAADVKAYIAGREVERCPPKTPLL